MPGYWYDSAGDGRDFDWYGQMNLWWTTICASLTELTNTLRGNLDKIVQHGRRADSIVKNMLLHSLEGSGEHRPVDINALVEEAANLVITVRGRRSKVSVSP
jgi:hypothetical protein